MKRIEAQFAERCKAALRAYLVGSGEASLHAAYELGREGLAQGFGVLDMAGVVHGAVAHLALETEPSNGRHVVARCEAFVLECFSAFEMAHRGAQEANAALRRMEEVREADIRRLAGELHDEAGQMLVAAHLSLRELAQELDPRAQQSLERVHEQLRKAESELRRIAHEMRPSMLDDLGLIPALMFLAKGFSARHGLTARIAGELPDRLPREVETALYRITQEALTNAARHARAREVIVTLEQAPHWLRLSIADDGCGFDSWRLPAAGTAGLGLRGIRERLIPLNGTLEVRSAPNRGTELDIELPLSEGTHAASVAG
jgi:signal transduction histidine kinase